MASDIGEIERRLWNVAGQLKAKPALRQSEYRQDDDRDARSPDRIILLDKESQLRALGMAAVEG